MITLKQSNWTNQVTVTSSIVVIADVMNDDLCFSSSEEEFFKHYNLISEEIAAAIAKTT